MTEVGGNMAIIRWDPFRDVERFFEPNVSAWKSSRAWDLAADVYEEGNNIVAEVQLPGIEPESTEISLENNMLYISGSREQVKERKEENYYYHEIQRGSFSRTIPLPTEVKAEEAEANFENGVLRVTVPKEQQEEHKRVTIPIKKVQTKKETGEKS
jgi:HSP20 family protein